MPIQDRNIPAGHPFDETSEESIFARPTFYAEFEPRTEHAAIVDSIYILRDQGRLTEECMSFASPLRELAFIFRKDGPGGKVVFNEPTLDPRRKARPFFGWIVGIKIKPFWLGSLSLADPPIVDCRDGLARAIEDGASRSDILGAVDRLLLALSLRTGQESGVVHLDGSHDRVSDLAVQVGKSVRTLQRQVRSATGHPPKRLIAAQRFRRSLYEISASGEGLSAIAFDLGFSDQAHLTREFRRHAGVTPGAFRLAWCGPDTRTVRFLQDARGPSRLTMAVWPLGTTTETR